MKVLDITDFYSLRGGGIRSHLDAKARALGRLGVAHVTVAPGDLDIEAQVDGVPSARIVRVRGPAQPYDPNYHFLLRTRHVALRIEAERPDVLEIDSLYLAALAARRVPRAFAPVRTSFWHSDHVDTHLAPALSRRLGARATVACLTPAWAAIRSVTGALDATIVASRVQRDKLVGHGIPRVHLIPFGVDRARFTPAARSAALRAELLGPGRDGAALFVAAGRLAVEKEWPVVVEAFLQVRARRDAVLVLVGDGPERAALEQRSGRHPDFRCLGFVGDRARFASILASADVLLHACRYETFGLGVAEAVACGLPIVVPDAGGAAELAYGPSGERFASGDAGACAAALERLLARDSTSLRSAALEAAARVASMDDHFASVVALYRELVARRSAA